MPIELCDIEALNTRLFVICLEGGSRRTVNLHRRDDREGRLSLGASRKRAEAFSEPATACEQVHHTQRSHRPSPKITHTRSGEDPKQRH
ncbi:hypothetical protein V6D24_22810 [Streptomyces sp. NRRL S-448]